MTKLGDDPLGRQAMEFYEAEQLAGDNILIDKDAHTGAALIIVNESNAQNQIVVISGACECISENETTKTVAYLKKSDILLTQMETNLEPVRKLLKCAKDGGIITVLNPAPAQHLEDEYYKYIDIITPNETEAQYLTGIQVVDVDTARQAAEIFINRGVKKVIITMGENGCYAFDGTNDKFFDAIDNGAPVDTTGAGDAFNGGFAAALARDYTFFDAVRYGSCVAALAIMGHGTAPAMPYRKEIDKLYANCNKQER